MFPTYFEAIKQLLDKRSHPDLAELYKPGFEVQVNVGRDGGNRVEGVKTKVWTDGLTSWYQIRIPKNASSEPEDNSSKQMSYDLFAHAEAVGMTGWNYLEKKSYFFGYDFDAIVGHSEKHMKKLSDAELESVSKEAQNIPWVTVRRSTSGSGLHLYVFLETPETTVNHTEHAALGRAILGLMSAVAGFDFAGKVDACGGILWQWARKMKGTNGLTLVKKGETLTEIPINWKSQVRVVSGNRRKVLPEFIEKQNQEDLEAIFDELSGQHPRVKLDDDHKKLIKWLQENKGFGWYDSDHHMLVTHTIHLKRAHEELKMRGIFETASSGTDLEEQNCYAFPLRGGAWSVRRYSRGCAEAASWEQDGVGFTKCYLNRSPDLGTVAKVKGGVEDAQGAYRFRYAEIAGDVARTLGASITVPNHMSTREASIKQHKDGNRLVVAIDKQSHDSPKEMEGWYEDKGHWNRVFNVNRLQGNNETEVGLFDEIVRHTVSESRQDAGWYVRVGTSWNYEPIGHVGKALLSLGRKKTEVDAVLGASVFKPWVIVNRPFQDEYPGDRLWNIRSAQFKYPRVPIEEVGEFPHWQMILDHIGKGLDEAIKSSGWAQANDIKTGSQYLKLWLASMLQDPYRPLPFLFLYNKAENTGKSIFHEAVDLLITDGVRNAGSAIKNKSDFNGELEGGILCFIEEINLRKNLEALHKIKDWVTSPNILIHRKGLTPYSQPNTTHWVHCANDPDACPVFPGDTRITMILVHELTAEEMIPKEDMKQFLRREAPHFLNSLLYEEIPPSGDRLGVPVITTSEKESLAKSNQNILDEFIDQHAHIVNGEVMLFAEFWDKFTNWIDDHEKAQWSKIRMSRSLPLHFPSGKPRGSPHVHIANIAWDLKPSTKPKLVLKGKDLVPSDN